MRTTLIILFLFLINNRPVLGQAVPIPTNYTVIDTARGDLDKDGIAELVVAYNTRQKSEEPFENIPRELVIYKIQGKSWVPWKRSQQALYGSNDGGMMGDPFGELKIQQGILLISHYGGSSWKWNHTDKYRFAHGSFSLIGYSAAYGKPCEYWTTVDFNLVTGKMIVKKEYEHCEDDSVAIYKKENETFYRKGLKIGLHNRNEREILIVTPKYRHEVYIANKND